MQKFRGAIIPLVLLRKAKLKECNVVGGDVEVCSFLHPSACAYCDMQVKKLFMYQLCTTEKKKEKHKTKPKNATQDKPPP